jgi:hypothetical protein
MVRRSVQELQEIAAEYAEEAWSFYVAGYYAQAIEMQLEAARWYALAAQVLQDSYAWQDKLRDAADILIDEMVPRKRDSEINWDMWNKWEDDRIETFLKAETSRRVLATFATMDEANAYIDEMDCDAVLLPEEGAFVVPDGDKWQVIAVR